MVRSLLLGLWLTLMPLALAGCATEPPQGPNGCATAANPCLQGTAVVQLDTGKGVVRIKLDGDAAPLTAGNFVDLVKRGVYNGTAFHRVVREPAPFVVQGGDPRSADPKVPSDQLGTGSFIDPASGEARLIPLEIRLNGDRAPRYGTPITTPGISGKLVKPHLRGSVAMARSQDPDSASSQFYVALQALPELDGSYAVFGQVISGMDVVDRLQQGDRLQRATLVEGGTLVRGKP
ncbi:MAG: peptidylprolyl isomerase [Cyanobacteriota bacterium]|nr:peptidylprolyl isomerase [Cyanobacteriota bacterium]